MICFAILASEECFVAMLLRKKSRRVQKEGGNFLRGGPPTEDSLADGGSDARKSLICINSILPYRDAADRGFRLLCSNECQWIERRAAPPAEGEFGQAAGRTGRTDKTDAGGGVAYR